MKDVMADDSGTAAVQVDQELLDARNACDRLDIKWHWKHKASSLQKMINDRGKTVDAEPPTVTATVDANTVHICNTSNPPRTIPHDVEAALQYMAAYKKANERLVRSFIESLL